MPPTDLHSVNGKNMEVLCMNTVTNFAIKFNPFFQRWEVFGSKSVIRYDELQPLFVSESFAECEAYIERMEEWDG